MNFNPWTLFSDFCIMSALLVLGLILRAKLKLFQKFLIPASLIAGFIGLALGPNGYNILPLSNRLGTYAGILIVVVFAAMPIGDKPSKKQLSGPALGGMFLNVTGIAIAQYGLGMAFSLYVLNRFWNLNSGFGLMLATGFYGGHGTAAAVGSIYKDLGWNDALGLGMTSATVGIIGGIIMGIIIINWGTRKGYTHYVGSPKDLPKELRTGLISLEDQRHGGKITVSSICVDPMAFHLALVLLASLGGYYLSKYITSIIPRLKIPAFCLSLLFGFIIQFVLSKTDSLKYVDRYTISRISGIATDYLIIAGVSSVKLSLVATYLLPLILLFSFGFLINWLWFLWVGARSSQEDWFERNMMAFGHASGVVATGILLQRVVDPDLKSRGMEDSGIADIFNRPIIIALQVIPPLLLVNGGMWPHIVTWVCIGAVIVMLFISKKLHWWNPSAELKVYNCAKSNFENQQQVS
ncbi:sodium:glutamate symporter [Crassaminicella thermophila]|uniref:Sodium:glutamate symporter n=1 Tax=Crassaminicella thermophila TaxID=2599308 RepID=A0A5C0SIY2_CRATE|nr:sodium/glutamate symporter [Crassaminicella thermophila]QEK12909.1 sodium:glutamate symporter [Crassaminicella thermophila]